MKLTTDRGVRSIVLSENDGQRKRYSDERR